MSAEIIPAAATLPPAPQPEPDVFERVGQIEIPGAPKWLDLAIAASGVKELAGEHDNPEILRYYRDAGHPEIRHDEVAWCAAFSCAMLERAGVASPKTLSARDFMRWGKKLDAPRQGCICVFSRGDPRRWQGHVGFFLEEKGDRIRILGGNQSDAVSAMWIPKSRLLGYRWPVTASNSRTMKAASMGAVGTALTQLAPVADNVKDIGGQFKALGEFTPVLTFVGTALIILALIAVVKARLDDAREKGR